MLLEKKVYQLKKQKEVKVEVVSLQAFLSKCEKQVVQVLVQFLNSKEQVLVPISMIEEEGVV